jgi:hypothetical protein
VNRCDSGELPLAESGSQLAMSRSYCSRVRGRMSVRCASILRPSRLRPRRLRPTAGPRGPQTGRPPPRRPRRVNGNDATGCRRWSQHLSTCRALHLPIPSECKGRPIPPVLGAVNSRPTAVRRGRPGRFLEARLLADRQRAAHTPLDDHPAGACQSRPRSRSEIRNLSSTARGRD